MIRFFGSFINTPYPPLIPLQKGKRGDSSVKSTFMLSPAKKLAFCVKRLGFLGGESFVCKCKTFEGVASVTVRNLVKGRIVKLSPFG
jgi:hypothetical protein